jgi:hypothetical protein
MKLKSWMVKKVNGMDDPGPREPQPQSDTREPSVRAVGAQRGGVPNDAEQLGPYRALIEAIREELEHFVTTQLRLHLAIAERDRYVLASVEVECDESDEHRDLLRRFIGEFKPEQIKHYLAKEVIAGLRNASAIDLSQFAGLNAAQQDDGTNEEEERYADLLAELRRGSPQSVARPYRVTLLGRWSQLDALPPGNDRGSQRSRSAQTPLSTPAFAIDIEDAEALTASTSHPSCRAVAMPLARERVAISSSMGPMPAAGIARCGSTKAPGGSSIPDRLTVFGSSRPMA